jgi:hypothetical protein
MVISHSTVGQGLTKMAIKFPSRDRRSFVAHYSIHYCQIGGKHNCALHNQISNGICDGGCMEPRLFNWCGGVLANLKDHDYGCKKGKQKQFRYGSLLVSFLLERVPLLQPQICMVSHPITEPWMEKWTRFSS